MQFLKRDREDAGMRHGSRNLHDVMVAILAKSLLKGRFSLELDPQTSHWDIGFNDLSEDEFRSIFPFAFRAGPIKWDLGNSENSHKAIRVSYLTNTQSRDFARAVAARFQVKI
jgi:hypothetical protein